MSRIFLNIILCVSFVFIKCEEVTIAGFFENNEPQEKAFRFAIDHVNSLVDHDEEAVTFIPLVNNDIQDEPFETFNHLCDALNTGITAIFGPRSVLNIDTVQSVCDTKEIPHITTTWNPKTSRHGTEVSFYPHPSLLSIAYLDVIKLWEWESFTIVYEDDESFLRISDFFVSAKQEGMLVDLVQLDQGGTGNYRSSVSQLRESEQRNFVIDCRIEILKDVLLHFQQFGLMTGEFKYFLINLDAHTIDLIPFQYSRANITAIRVINPDKPYVQEISDLFGVDDSFSLEPMAWKLQTETALVIDAVHMFYTALHDRKKQSSVPIVYDSNSLDCQKTSSWEHGQSVVNLLKTNTYEGLTGLVKFNTEGFRSDFDITVYELKAGGITDVAIWNSSSGLNITRIWKENFNSDSESLRNKSFTIITTLTDPYGMLKETHETLTGNDRFEGYGIDLIQKIAEMEGFNYTFILREDKKNGEINKTTKKWTGMIGDLLEHRADLAICDFTITSDRSDVIDFTVPFMNMGVSILFRKPEKAPPSFFSFADPFALETWIALALSFFSVSFALFIMGRLSPDEWTNPYPCIEEPEYLVNQFSLSNSIWFVTGSLMAQGSEIAPIGISTRMTAGMWWFFCLLIIASYTANLAAFLATENPVELFKDIQSLYENAPMHKIKYGAKAGGATYRFFTEAEEGTIFRKIGDVMKDNAEDQSSDNDLGVKRAERERYAFFMESTSIEYATQRHCDLKQYGSLLDDKGYGIAMRKDSPYRKRLSTALLRLQSSFVLDELKKKWWEERRGGGQCEGAAAQSEADPLDVPNVGGCFWVTIYGTILAGILVIFEHLGYVIQVARKSKLAFVKVFWQEFKFYTDFNSNVKPVIGSSSEDKSKSDSETKEEDATESKTKSKSKSAKSKSKSPAPVEKSKSNLSKGSRKSKEHRSQTPLRYGFVIPSSTEKLNEIL